jgi:hypothetical protein
MQIGEFFVRLGVDAETMKVKDFVSSIGEIPVKAAVGIAALAGISFSIKEMAGDAMDAAVAFQAFEAQTGLSSQELQTWQKVALQANVSAESVTGSVSSLQRQLAEIRMGRGNISPFQILGIDPRQDAFKVIDQLRARVKGMDRPTATNLIAQMGLTPDMMQVLTLSEEKFRAFSHTVTGMSPKQVAAFQKLKLELVKLKMEIHDTFFRALGNILPLILPLLQTILPKLAGFLENIVSSLQMLAMWLGQHKVLLAAFAGAIVLVAAAFAPITVAIGLFLLMLEDLFVYLKGGDSLIGSAIEGLKTIFDAPIESAKVFLGLLQDIMKYIGMGTLEDMKYIGKNPVEDMKVFAKMIGSAFSNNDPFNPAVIPNMTINQTNTFNIHSTAPAEDVGRAVVREQDHATGAAANHIARRSDTK